ncbi:AAA family ATPase [Yersinia mollaretii]|nr:AAA family ATPase [Yersinia mollaretii]PJE87128.1 AAA family ATPase [Yersinia mollaretii]
MEKKAHPEMGQKFPRQQPFIFQAVGVLVALAHRLPTP